VKIIAPSFAILALPEGGEVLRALELYGRTCYKSEDKITADSAEGFVRRIIKSGHHSVIEHVAATVRFVCDRGVTHELVRHRLAAYSQESTRYCDYSKENGEGGGHLQFIRPVWVDKDVLGIHSEEYRATPDDATNTWLNCMWNLEDAYKRLRCEGWQAQEARAILPNSLKTEIVMTANLREWRHVFRLRAAPAAHPQMRALMQDMLAGFRAAVPVIFDDIHP
jgi:thymidylate synthase (FAD)